MKLMLSDYLIIVQSLVAAVMLFLAILLWIKKRGLSNILFFLIILFIYILLAFKSLAYYHIFNIEILAKVGRIPLVNYVIEFIVLLLAIFFATYLLKESEIDKKPDNNKD